MHWSGAKWHGERRVGCTPGKLHWRRYYCSYPLPNKNWREQLSVSNSLDHVFQIFFYCTHQIESSDMHEALNIIEKITNYTI
jgi:hypothetical protein